jgi:cytochrome c-type biogenesis protein CcmH
MIALWLVFAVLLVIALAFILPPLLQSAETINATEVKEANVAVYRDQMRELEADLNNGIVSKEQYDQDRDELERRLLEDVSHGNGSESKNSKPPMAARSLAFGLAIGIPLIATLFYLKIGNQNARSETVATSGAQESSPSAPFANQSGEMTSQQIEANVAALAKRLEQNPNDAQGWTMLARSYSQMERYKDAAEAFEHATGLVGNDADLWADYAYAVAMINGKEMQGKPMELVNKALQIDPNNRKALVLAGEAAFKQKHYNQAIEYWQRLLQALPPNSSEVAQPLNEKIAEAKRLAKSETSK